ncbi:YwqH-like family protein [Parageobacillus toebii]|uniref:YwqH-like family protein n=1 Tax=Parageobacillus toebii TaxID=153151 RepID=UPI002815B507|nr:DUF5082 family protein [Parageobacillus toebii]WMT18242.1 DUF5082 family protein [Parageobacillus toebii]
MSLSYLYALLREKERQLMRLQTCQSQLLQCQSEFFQQEHLCTKPELTAKTWHGSRAEQFDSIRNSGILWQYRAIEHEQFDDTLQALQNKIVQLQNEISELRSSIANLEAKQAQMTTK